MGFKLFITIIKFLEYIFFGNSFTLSFYEIQHVFSADIKYYSILIAYYYAIYTNSLNIVIINYYEWVKFKRHDLKKIDYSQVHVKRIFGL